VQRVSADLCTILAIDVTTSLQKCLYRLLPASLHPGCTEVCLPLYNTVYTDICLPLHNTSYTSVYSKSYISLAHNYNGYMDVLLISILLVTYLDVSIPLQNDY
jgi:hypothetical protein